MVRGLEGATFLLVSAIGCMEMLKNTKLFSYAIHAQVPTERADPVILRSLCMHDYLTGEPINDYDLRDYKEKWGHEYLMFHRQDLHKTLLETATGEEGDGYPCELFTNHKVEDVDAEAGWVKFTNGKEIVADLIVGSDGIRVIDSSVPFAHVLAC